MMSAEFMSSICSAGVRGSSIVLMTPLLPKIQGRERATSSSPNSPLRGDERGTIFFLSCLMISTRWVRAVAIP